MLSTFSALFLFLASLVAIPAPIELPTTNGPAAVQVAEPVWTAVDAETGAVLVLHDDARLTLSEFDAATNAIVTATARRGAMLFAPQGTPGGPLPTIKTTWTDAQGVQHEVTTPVDSATDAGIDRARRIHKRLVALEQADFPPRPVAPG